MDVYFKLPDEPASPDLQYSRTPRRTRVVADGHKLVRSKDGGYLVPLRDGRTRSIYLDTGLDGTPVVLLETYGPFRLEPTAADAAPLPRRKSPWWPPVLRVLPVLVLLAGGLPGLVIGGAGALVNWRLIQASHSVGRQLLTAVAMTLVCGGVLLAVGALLGRRVLV
ncbi:MAG: hypothetical protein ACRDJU_00025 [Actinomycetota bacterium]